MVLSAAGMCTSSCWSHSSQLLPLLSFEACGGLLSLANSSLLLYYYYFYFLDNTRINRQINILALKHERLTTRHTRKGNFVQNHLHMRCRAMPCQQNTACARLFSSHCKCSHHFVPIAGCPAIHSCNRMVRINWIRGPKPAPQMSTWTRSKVVLDVPRGACVSRPILVN